MADEQPEVKPTAPKKGTKKEDPRGTKVTVMGVTMFVKG